jgi:hypothetical protein
MQTTALNVGIQSGNIIRCAGLRAASRFDPPRDTKRQRFQKLGFVVPDAMMGPFFGLPTGRPGCAPGAGDDLKTILNILERLITCV